MRKKGLRKNIVMMIVGDNISRISGNCAIHKFIIVRI